MIIKQEPVNNIRRSQGYFQNRGGGGRGGCIPGNGNRRCYNCDAPNFTLDHIANCPAKRVTCNACRKVGHFERTCRGIKRGNNHWRARGGFGSVRDLNEHHQRTHKVDKT